MRIARFLFRTGALLALLAAIVLGTFDAIQSVSASSVTLTSLGNAWLNVDPEGLTLVEMAADDYISPDIWRPYIAPLLAQPAFAMFLLIALAFWILGYKKPHFAGRFSA